MLWDLRHHVARWLIRTALWVMPRCRYRTDLIDRLLELRWHVEDSVREGRLVP